MSHCGGAGRGGHAVRPGRARIQARREEVADPHDHLSRRWRPQVREGDTAGRSSVEHERRPRALPRDEPAPRAPTHLRGARRALWAVEWRCWLGGSHDRDISHARWQPADLERYSAPMRSAISRQGAHRLHTGPVRPAQRADEPNDPFVANQMAVTAAHELGHVLGLKHVPNRCALMYKHGNQGCAKPPQPWQLRCRLLESDDVRGAIRRYGGRMRPLAPEFCDASPAPGPPTELVATFDPADRTVRVSWTNPRTAGIRFANVTLRPGGCPPSFDDALFEEVRPGERSTAKLDAGNGSGLHCVAVRGGDVYGRTGAPATTEIEVPAKPRPEREPEPEIEP